mmetsp:Transcript_60474/g.112288  ORF Transcript_60474/g.112288 Transcript_60474/m.112288 type:complete len:229 (+) Transcript_60474:337-1023(+)
MGLMDGHQPSLGNLLPVEQSGVNISGSGSSPLSLARSSSQSEGPKETRRCLWPALAERVASFASLQRMPTRLPSDRARTSVSGGRSHSSSCGLQSCACSRASRAAVALAMACRSFAAAVLLSSWTGWGCASEGGACITTVVSVCTGSACSTCCSCPVASTARCSSSSSSRSFTSPERITSLATCTSLLNSWSRQFFFSSPLNGQSRPGGVLVIRPTSTSPVIASSKAS